MNASSWVASVWQIGILYAVQSTILILVVMAVVRLCRVRDAAVLSMIYRFTMVAVVASPMVTVVMKQADVNGWWPAMPNQEVAAEANASFSRPAISIPNDFATTGDVPPQGIDSDAIPNEPVVLTTADRFAVLDVQPHEVAGAEAAGDEKKLEMSGVGATAYAGTAFACKTIAVAAWLVASLALLIRHGRACLSLRRSLKHSVPATSEIQALCDQMARDLQVKSPRVVCSPYFESPFLTGVWRPVIHFCSDDGCMMDASPDGEFRDVLAHELSHLKRHDLIVRMMNHVVLSLLFFQPLLWRLVDWIEGTAEDVCDGFALGLGAAMLRASASRLGRTLRLSSRLRRRNRIWQQHAPASSQANHGGRPPPLNSSQSPCNDHERLVDHHCCVFSRYDADSSKYSDGANAHAFASGDSCCGNPEHCLANNYLAIP